MKIIFEFCMQGIAAAELEWTDGPTYKYMTLTIHLKGQTACTIRDFNQAQQQFSFGHTSEQLSSI